MPTPGAFSPIQRVPSGFDGPGGTGFRPFAQRRRSAGTTTGLAACSRSARRRRAWGRSPARSRPGRCARACGRCRAAACWCSASRRSPGRSWAIVRWPAPARVSSAQRRARPVAEQLGERGPHRLHVDRDARLRRRELGAGRGRTDHARSHGRPVDALRDPVDDSCRPGVGVRDRQRDAAVRRRRERRADGGVDVDRGSDLRRGRSSSAGRRRRSSRAGGTPRSIAARAGSAVSPPTRSPEHRDAGRDRMRLLGGGRGRAGQSGGGERSRRASGAREPQFKQLSTGFCPTASVPSSGGRWRPEPGSSNHARTRVSGRSPRRSALDEVTASVLVRRGYDEPAEARRFLEGALPGHDPFALGDMREAVETIAAAVAVGQADLRARRLRRRRDLRDRARRPAAARARRRRRRGTCRRGSRRATA